MSKYLGVLQYDLKNLYSKYECCSSYCLLVMNLTATADVGVDVKHAYQSLMCNRDQ